MPAVASGPEPAPPPPPSAAEVRTAVRVLLAFAAEGRFHADLEASRRVLGILLHALRALGGAPPRPAPPVRSTPGWRERLFPSPEDQRRRFEAANTLGVESSCVSGATWEVSHPAWDPAVAYEEAGAPPFLVGLDEPIRLPQWDAQRGGWGAAADTEISLQPYTDAAGRPRRLKLRIWRNVARVWAMRDVDDVRDDVHPVDRRELVEEKLVRAASGGGVDARGVVFRSKRPGGATRYLRLRLSGTGDEVELREVRPVTPPPPAAAA